MPKLEIIHLAGFALAIHSHSQISLRSQNTLTELNRSQKIASVPNLVRYLKQSFSTVTMELTFQEKFTYGEALEGFRAS